MCTHVRTHKKIPEVSSTSVAKNDRIIWFDIMSFRVTMDSLIIKFYSTEFISVSKINNYVHRSSFTDRFNNNNSNKLF
ncbi:hypothetical protein Hanom_Chr08g00732671 [Helianthus anomalus]